MSKFFMMAKIVEKKNRKVGDCPDSKKAKDETLQNGMDPAAFSALMKEKMNPSPKLKKEVEELEMKLEKVTKDADALTESMMKNTHRTSTQKRDDKDDDDKLQKLIDEKEILESKLFRLTVFRANISM